MHFTEKSSVVFFFSLEVIISCKSIFEKMNCILIILSFIFMRCHSFVTLSLDELKKNDVGDFLSGTTHSYPLADLTDDKARLGKQKSLDYPEKSKQMLNPEGHKMDRLFQEFDDPKKEQIGQWLNQLRLLLIESLDDEARLKYFNENSLQTVNETLWTLSTLQDKLVLMKDANIFLNLLGSSEKLNAIYQNGFKEGLYIKPDSLSSTSKYEGTVYEDEMNSVGNEVDQLARIRYFFEELCRKHHSMLSKLKIEHNH